MKKLFSIFTIGLMLLVFGLSFTAAPPPDDGTDNSIVTELQCDQHHQIIEVQSLPATDFPPLIHGRLCGVIGTDSKQNSIAGIGNDRQSFELKSIYSCIKSQGIYISDNSPITTRKLSCSRI